MASVSSLTNISNFTSKDRFTRLINGISTDIENNNSSHIRINESIVQLNAPVTFVGTGNSKLDSIAANASYNTSANLNRLTNTFGLATDPQRPEVINLSAAGQINTANFNAMQIIDYLPPSNIALSSFDKLGQSIDKSIKDSLLVQTFHLKGADILCTTLCLLMSLLPCTTTNKIVDEIQKIKDLQSAIDSGMQGAIATEKFALDELNSGLSGGVTGLANTKDIKNSLKTAFNTPKTGNAKEDAAAKIKSLTSGLSAVVQVINLLVSVAKLGWTDPKAILGFLVNGMFDLLENVLLAVQALAVQMADKIMNKVIAPIEKYFRSNTFPALCGIGAQILFKKILAVIYNFKKKILAFIADLFSFQKTARKKFELFNSNMLWTLELSALLRVLNLLLSNFLDIAIACGVGRRPCGDSDGPNLSENFNEASPDPFIPPTLPPNAQVATPPDGDILNSIANKLEPMVNSIFPGTDAKVKPGKVVSTMENMPSILAGMLTNMDLGINTTISIENNKATIVYNNQSLCGAR